MRREGESGEKRLQQKARTHKGEANRATSIHILEKVGGIKATVGSGGKKAVWQRGLVYVRG